MPRLDQNSRNQAIGMLRVGMLKIDVARRFNCHVSTITRLQMRFQQTGGVADRPRPGRPRVTTPGQDNHIRLSHLRNRFLPASETARQTIGRHGFVKVT
ncbi:MAG: helix-turn-helix domain-containing protein [Sedimenticola sp.]